MTTLISYQSPGGEQGRCDAKCYNAWGPECHCICQGGNPVVVSPGANPSGPDSEPASVRDACERAAGGRRKRRREAGRPTAAATRWTCPFCNHINPPITGRCRRCGR